VEKIVALAASLEENASLLVEAEQADLSPQFLQLSSPFWKQIERP
jgi:hypothetical protein